MEKGKKKIRILFVDDEVNNLHAFKAAFRLEYDIKTASSALEAEEWLENNQVDLILCDQRMPVTTGVEFFSSIVKKYPKAIRILVTGYTDIESVIKAINLGHVFRYINKPWNESEIRSSIEEAYRYLTQSNQLEDKVKELSIAYKELDNFSYSVSHDLKGPLMSIMGAMNIVNHAKDKNEGQVIIMLDLIEKAAAQLSEFIENMHVYYKSKRGHLIVEKISLEEIKKEMLAIHSLKCLQENINLSFNLTSNSPLFSTDATKVKIIVNNLLSNALKYQRRTEKNKKVDITMSIDGEVLTIIAADNGMGIEEQYLDNIFGLFFRATSEVGGSGFGLYNVKEIVTTLGGTITVNSTINEGSIFKITLPSK
ncbi:MAG: hybrid sensor histidine kinase/response regulator [Bacteroidia bacterium]|nr:hybrid sensor histidine kinase/response regulator [Bacteroidia bacterium]MBP9688211.1 hybrid sensor histidine kinase/response regulator [Bacteroidia bacterium]